MATAAVTAPQLSTVNEEPQSQNTTQNNLSGNHVVNGSLDIQNASVIDIPINGKPIWLVSASMMSSAIFVAVMEDGRVQAFKVMGQT